MKLTYMDSFFFFFSLQATFSSSEMPFLCVSSSCDHKGLFCHSYHCSKMHLTEVERKVVNYLLGAFQHNFHKCFPSSPFPFS